MREDGRPGFLEKLFVSCTTGAIVGGISGMTDAPEESRKQLTDTMIDLALKGDEMLHDRRQRKQWEWMTDVLNDRR